MSPQLPAIGWTGFTWDVSYESLSDLYILKESSIIRSREREDAEKAKELLEGLNEANVCEFEEAFVSFRGAMASQTNVEERVSVVAGLGAVIAFLLFVGVARECDFVRIPHHVSPVCLRYKRVPTSSS